MTAKSSLDLQGNFHQHPFAELLVEIAQEKLSGSLRLERGEQKTIVYFRRGALVYAVANSRRLRLFNILLERKRVDEKTLGDIRDLANDLKLSAALQRKRLFTREQIDEVTTIQIESILVDALTWPDGDWHFSPLTRLRDDIVYPVDVYKVLADYARCVPSTSVYDRFRSVQESFYRHPEPTSTVIVQAHENYVLDRFEDGQFTIEELRSRSALPEAAMLQALYVLWLGGMLLRSGWNSAFTKNKLEEIRLTPLSLVKQASPMEKVVVPSIEKELPAPTPVEEDQKPRDISLEEYLDRIENAESLYDILGTRPDASLSQIKHAYFAMAKLFHPDRFHREEASKLRRIQVAFTEIARAYETLKTRDSREIYDAKLQKEIEYRERTRAAIKPDESTTEVAQPELGLDNFERGLEALQEEEYAAAAGHLARAVHYSPQNALYHAYFGHSLSRLEKQQHKAENELQTAVKLDPLNSKIRLMLVEFFVEMNMTKRAVGELTRFLERVPGDREAQKLLDKLQAKAST